MSRLQLTAQPRWLIRAQFRLIAKVRLDAELPWHWLADKTDVMLKPITY